MKTFDVAIIGGGPAGVAAAAQMLRTPYSFCLIDARHFPREKLCAGGVTSKCLSELDELSLPVDKDAGVFVSDVILMAGNKRYPYRKQAPVLMTDRAKFDNDNFQYIKSRCEDVYEGEKILWIKDKVIATDKRNIGYKYIIFADGANGYSQRITRHDCKGGFCVQVDIPVSGFKDMIVSLDAIENGYGWVFPKPDHISLGMGKFAGIRFDYRAALADFGAKLGFTFDQKDVRGFPIPNGNYLATPVKGSMFFVGDAAALVDPLTGEGIYYAVLSGKFAAQAIAHRLEDSRFNMEEKYLADMAPYHAILKKKFRVSRMFFTKIKNPLVNAIFTRPALVNRLTSTLLK